MVPIQIDFVLQSIVEVQANFCEILSTGNIFFEFYPRPGIALEPKEKTVRNFNAPYLQKFCLDWPEIFGGDSWVS